MFTLSGIIRVSEKENEFFDRPKKENCTYHGLNKKANRYATRELVTITGGTGLVSLVLHERLNIGLQRRQKICRYNRT